MVHDVLDDDEINYTTAFPLPFRVLVLAGIGILGWATNLHGLEAFGIDVVDTMELRVDINQRPTSIRIGGFTFTPPSPLYGPVYRISAAYFGWCFLSWAIYRYATDGNFLFIDVFGYIPGVSALLILFILVCPYNIFYKHERDKFLHTIRRCVASSMDSPVYFADIVFADIFTSFAKVLGDVWLSLRMLLPGNSLLLPPREDTMLRWLLPTIMCLPYLVRFKQCVVEYSLPTNASRRPLYNALKYATSFPVIFLSAAQRIVETDLREELGKDVSDVAWHGEHPLFRLWLLSAAINSLYSFWWDVTNDWGMELLKFNEAEHSHGERPLPRRLVLPHLHSGTPLMATEVRTLPTPRQLHSTRKHPLGLRPILLYPLPVYPLLMFLNLVLRLTWSIKLSSHLHSKSDGSITIFFLEVAEIVRRWMWVFIRVEWETIKRAQETASPTVEVVEEGGYEMVQTPDAEDVRILSS
ncbi:EXS-domain-containing protein [Hymenopellis radicata]|nr:EXS-domain-containing protein [Hymenopellis radicata]